MQLINIYPEIPGLETSIVQGLSGGLQIARNDGVDVLEATCVKIVENVDGDFNKISLFYAGVLAAYGAHTDIAYQN